MTQSLSHVANQQNLQKSNYPIILVKSLHVLPTVYHEHFRSYICPRNELQFQMKILAQPFD